MSWAEKDGYCSRPLDCHDRLFQLLCSIGTQVNRENWLLMINAKIDVSGQDVIVTPLQKAWKAPRFRHPDIAFEVLETEKRYCPIRDDQALEYGVMKHSAFKVRRWMNSSLDNIAQSPMPRFTASLPQAKLL